MPLVKAPAARRLVRTPFLPGRDDGDDDDEIISVGKRVPPMSGIAVVRRYLLLSSV